MKDIIKAQCYQMKKFYIFKPMFLCMIFFHFLMIGVFFMDAATDMGMTGCVGLSDYIAGGNLLGLLNFMILFMVIAVAEIAGKDMADKTVNQELLSGHSRAQVYFGRVIIAAAACIIGTALFLWLPWAFFIFTGKWGDTLPFSAILIRALLFYFPVLQLVSEIMMLTYIVKNALYAGIIGAGLVLAEGMAINFLPGMNPYFLVGSKSTYLFQIPSFATYRMRDLKTFYLYDAMPDTGTILYTIVSSLLLSAAFLWIGYRFFKKDDMR